MSSVGYGGVGPWGRFRTVWLLLLLLVDLELVYEIFFHVLVGGCFLSTCGSFKRRLYKLWLLIATKNTRRESAYLESFVASLRKIGYD